MTSRAAAPEPLADETADASHPTAPLDLAQVRRVAAEAPVFIVGCPRSGTTLLRLVLDSHPEVAIPYETTFVVPIALDPAATSWSAAEVAERVMANRWFFVLGLSPEEVTAALAELRPASPAALMRILFAMHSVRHGKSHWGDKTPLQVLHIRQLAGLFPDARFIHVLRDGRPVSASLSDMPWGPGSPVAAAITWRICLRVGRRAGAALGPERYHEVRLEDFVADPEATSRQLCDFLGLTYDEAMLRYDESAEERILAEHADWQGNLRRRPTGSLRDWTAGLSPRRRASLELVVRSGLDELGYDSGPRPAPLRRLAAAAWTVAEAAAFPFNQSWAWMLSILVGASNRRVRHMGEIYRVVFFFRALDRSAQRVVRSRLSRRNPPQ